ncbi:MAG: membrane protein insertase YidC [Elusimicrobiota bacterium]
MQKNLVLAVVLSSAVYIFWYSYIEKRPMLNPASAPTAQSQQSSPAASAATALTISGQSAVAAASGPLEADWTKRSVELNLNKATYAFHPAGASIKSVVYQGPVSPVELVKDPSPGFLSSFDDLTFTLKSKTNDSVTFEARAANGVIILKKFTLNGEHKINLLEITAVNPSAAPAVFAAWNIKLGPGLGTVKSEEKENPSLWKAQYTFQEDGKKFPTIKTIKENQKAGPWIWAGVDNRYFLAAVMGGDLKRDVLNISQPEIDGKKAPLLSIPFEAELLAPRETRVWRVEFYIGPKDYKLLQTLGRGLDRSVDFGFFSPLAKIANSALDYFQKLTGNYGVAIVIISVLLQILIFPLSWKSYKAMAVMKKIQPEMQAIQARYKSDPKRMNTEVMELYKRHGTNPLGGCLPMLLQIPIFFALFTALRNSWPLHGAPFIFWIKDLSAKDPYYILPLVMGGIMFLQQHLSPQTGGDKAQMAMMKWMPVVFTFMFLTFPSGLVLYWLINSIWGFAQTMILQKQQALKDKGY